MTSVARRNSSGVVSRDRREDGRHRVVDPDVDRAELRLDPLGRRLDLRRRRRRRPTRPRPGPRRRRARGASPRAAPRRARSARPGARGARTRGAVARPTPAEAPVIATTCDLTPRQIRRRPQRGDTRPRSAKTRPRREGMKRPAGASVSATSPSVRTRRTVKIGFRAARTPPASTHSPASAPASSASPVKSSSSSGVLEVAVADRLGGAVGDRADRAGRVRAGVLREERGAGDEDVRRVPDLAVGVRDRVARGSVPMMQPPVGMGRLVLRDVVGGDLGR